MCQHVCATKGTASAQPCFLARSQRNCARPKMALWDYMRGDFVTIVIDCRFAERVQWCGSAARCSSREAVWWCSVFPCGACYQWWALVLSLPVWCACSGLLLSSSTARAGACVLCSVKQGSICSSDKPYCVLVGFDTRAIDSLEKGTGAPLRIKVRWE